MVDKFAQLRELLSDSRDWFPTIYGLVAGMEEQEIVIDYANDHLESKHPLTRRLPSKDLENPPPQAQLARFLELYLQVGNSREYGDISFLTHLFLDGNPTYFPFEKTPGLKELTVCSPSMQDFSWLPTLNGLEQLNVCSSSFVDFSTAKEQPSLERLYARYGNLESLQGLENFPALKILDAGGNTNFTTLEGINACENLQEAYLSGLQVDLSELETFPDLEGLYLNKCGLTNFSSLKTQPSLEFIDLSGNPLISLRGLERHPNLKTVLESEDVYNAHKEQYGQILGKMGARE